MSAPPRDRKVKVWKRDKWRCRYCHCKVEVPGLHPHDAMATVDHVVPKSAGGSNRVSNLVTACLKCNNEKGAHLAWSGPAERTNALSVALLDKGVR